MVKAWNTVSLVKSSICCCEKYPALCTCVAKAAATSPPSAWLRAGYNVGQSIWWQVGEIFFRVPWFQDFMTHETARHFKRRKSQSNKTKLKLHPQVPARHPARHSPKVFLQGLQQRVFCKVHAGSSEKVPAKIPDRGLSLPATFSKKTRTKWNPKTIQKLSSHRFQQGCKNGSSKVQARLPRSRLTTQHIKQSKKHYKKKNEIHTCYKFPSKMFQPGVPARGFRRSSSKVSPGSSSVPLPWGSRKGWARVRQASNKIPTKVQQGSGSVPVFRSMHFDGTFPAPESETQQNHCWESSIYVWDSLLGGFTSQILTIPCGAGILSWFWR